VEFAGAHIASIEAALENDSEFQGHWARLTNAELSPAAQTLQPVAGWRVELPAESVACPGVEQLQVVIDKFFPNSDPRVIAIGLKEDGSWPHVEDVGRLCLSPSRFGADSGERILLHIRGALDLLNFDKPTRKAEFQREFATYWQRGGVDTGDRAPKHRSLVKPDGQSRVVWYALDPGNRAFVWADTREELVAWFKNAGVPLESKEIRGGWAAWLATALAPADFPKTGQQLLALAEIPDAALASVARLGQRLPVLLGAQTATGPVWVAADLAPGSTTGLQRQGSSARQSATKLRNRLADVSVRRLPVERIDGTYIHGRDHNKDYAPLSLTRVAIVGCGSLGGYVARLLAQAGVGRLVLIDGDTLASHNTSRHVLGQFYLGLNKAKALAASLEQDFPHRASPLAFSSRIEKLSAEQWRELRKCEVIISAGIDVLGDREISRWRREDILGRPCHVSAWVEPFALAGHAVALFDDRDIGAVLDEDGFTRYELTKWKSTSQYEIAEAGCGNSFQPHGAVDLQRTVTMAARLCLDILSGRVKESTRSVWLGDRNAVEALGGTPAAEFDQSNAEKVLSWPPDAPVVAP
jgi:hypothetical protein